MSEEMISEALQGLGFQTPVTIDHLWRACAAISKEKVSLAPSLEGVEVTVGEKSFVADTTIEALGKAWFLFSAHKGE